MPRWARSRPGVSYSVPLRRPRWCMIAQSGNHRRPASASATGAGRPQQPPGRPSSPRGSSHASSMRAGRAERDRQATRKNRRPDRVASSMRAIVYAQTGDSSVFELVERDVPEPGPGEVRVKVVVSGVNPTDWKARAGAGPGRPTPFPEVVPDQDGSGVVDAVGPGVTGFEVGDRVWVYPRGPRAADGHCAGVRGAAGRSGRAASGCRELRHRAHPSACPR